MSLITLLPQLLLILNFENSAEKDKSSLNWCKSNADHNQLPVRSWSDVYLSNQTDASLDVSTLFKKNIDSVVQGELRDRFTDQTRSFRTKVRKQLLQKEFNVNSTAELSSEVSILIKNLEKTSNELVQIRLVSQLQAQIRALHKEASIECQSKSNNFNTCFSVQANELSSIVESNLNKELRNIEQLLAEISQVTTATEFQTWIFNINSLNQFPSKLTLNKIGREVDSLINSVLENCCDVSFESNGSQRLLPIQASLASQDNVQCNLSTKFAHLFALFFEQRLLPAVRTNLEMIQVHLSAQLRAGATEQQISETLQTSLLTLLLTIDTSVRKQLAPQVYSQLNIGLSTCPVYCPNSKQLINSLVVIEENQIANQISEYFSSQVSQIRVEKVIEQFYIRRDPTIFNNFINSLTTILSQHSQTLLTNNLINFLSFEILHSCELNFNQPILTSHPTTSINCDLSEQLSSTITNFNSKILTPRLSNRAEINRKALQNVLTHNWNGDLLPFYQLQQQSIIFINQTLQTLTEQYLRALIDFDIKKHAEKCSFQCPSEKQLDLNDCVDLDPQIVLDLYSENFQSAFKENMNQFQQVIIDFKESKDKSLLLDHVQRFALFFGNDFTKNISSVQTLEVNDILNQCCLPLQLSLPDSDNFPSFSLINPTSISPNPKHNVELLPRFGLGDPNACNVYDQFSKTIDTFTSKRLLPFYEQLTNSAVAHLQSTWKENAQKNVQQQFTQFWGIYSSLIDHVNITTRLRIDRSLQPNLQVLQKSIESCPLTCASGRTVDITQCFTVPQETFLSDRVFDHIEHTLQLQLASYQSLQAHFANKTDVNELASVLSAVSKTISLDAQFTADVYFDYLDSLNNCCDLTSLTTRNKPTSNEIPNVNNSSNASCNISINLIEEFNNFGNVSTRVWLNVLLDSYLNEIDIISQKGKNAQHKIDNFIQLNHNVIAKIESDFFGHLNEGFQQTVASIYQKTVDNCFVYCSPSEPNHSLATCSTYNVSATIEVLSNEYRNLMNQVKKYNKNIANQFNLVDLKDIKTQSVQSYRSLYTDVVINHMKSKLQALIDTFLQQIHETCCSSIEPSFNQSNSNSSDLFI